eukprot:TRINITY_DN4002_c0_g1_i1.p1 TRINITY_DN4002_c0_g1~~TRINITY_DN4002_c0_g1_i1.p1  ORF type:complete len:612 (+),score=160.21 TRINITY_DN4002_c0_g1_i1:92-1837(+)
MAVKIAVAAEVAGEKHNYELAFGTVPSLAQLLAEAEAVLTRVSGVPFRIRAAQLYDPAAADWADLFSSDQLSHRCQVYVFPQSATAAPPPPPPPQRETVSPPRPQAAQAAVECASAGVPDGHPRATAPLPCSVAGGEGQPPPAAPPSRQAGPLPRDGAGARTPRSSAAAVPPRQPPPEGECAARAAAAAPSSYPPPPPPLDPARRRRVSAVFAAQRSAEGIFVDEYLGHFRPSALGISSPTLVELFHQCDQDQDGMLSLPELELLATRRPALLDAVHGQLSVGAAQRAADESCSSAQRAALRVLRGARDREADAERALAQVRGEEEAATRSLDRARMEGSSRRELAAAAEADAARQREAAEAASAAALRCAAAADEARLRLAELERACAEQRELVARKEAQTGCASEAAAAARDRVAQAESQLGAAARHAAEGAAQADSAASELKRLQLQVQLAEGALKRSREEVSAELGRLPCSSGSPRRTPQWSPRRRELHSASRSAPAPWPPPPMSARSPLRGARDFAADVPGQCAAAEAAAPAASAAEGHGGAFGGLTDAERVALARARAIAEGRAAPRHRPLPSPS